MAFGKDSLSKQFKWYLIVIYVALMVIIVLAFFTDIFRTSEPGAIPQLVWLLSIVALLFTVILVLSNIYKILDMISRSGAKMEKIASELEKNRSELMKINHNTKLTEKAKAIAFRDDDRESLREAVFDKLQQQDFDTTQQIIDEISHDTVYKGLAVQLRKEADKYCNATDNERENQVIAHIEKLFDNYQWAKASVLIEKLIASSPQSERAKEMRQKLVDKKDERKKILLAAWDHAVKREATDRSLEILKELDPYLTPNEGLALQEAAKDIFKNKLHNLGVQFSLAVSGRQWTKALEVGRQITQDFPNSRMADEIREKMDILKQKVGQ